MTLKTHVTENKENIRIASQTLSRIRCRDWGLFDGRGCSVVKAPLEVPNLLKALSGPGLEAGRVGLSDDLRHLLGGTHP